MILTLAIRNASRLDNGSPIELILDKKEVTIGRSPACDWSLPDTEKFVSSKHCQVKYADGGYVLVDLSTNGTFLNGSVERMPAEHRIASGDVIQIGKYQVQATLSEETKVDAGAVRAEPPAAADLAPEPTPLPPEAEEPASATMFMATDELWDKMTVGNDVDWARGGFGGNGKREATMWMPSPPPPGEDAGDGDVGLATAAEQDLDRLVVTFLEEAGIAAKDVPNRSPDLVLRAGRIMKRLVAGLVVMVEARARAKSQMGAEATSLSFEGNNPIKFARTPEQALARLLNPSERGFMDGEQAVEDAFVDLQAHQVATLKAMQKSLRSTMDRFSPGAIRRRAEIKGVFARILPTARDAALWQNYEREFGLVAQESDEAFLEVFAKYFRKAYEEQTRQEMQKR